MATIIEAVPSDKSVDKTPTLVEEELVGNDGDDADVPDVGNKFEIEGPWNKGNPIHENMTIAAIRRSKLNDGSWTRSTLENLTGAQREYVRGAMWPDDPDCLLFDDQPNDNWDFSSGLLWYNQFDAAKDKGDRDTVTQRSHFGDLQWLHSMASSVGEPALTTQTKMIAWMRFVLDIWWGSYPYDFATNQVPLLVQLNLTHRSTVSKLFSGSTQYYKGINHKARALGSALHLIQDSYAKGHVFRRSNFAEGDGDVSTFHAYNGQDSSKHSEWDSKGGDDLDARGDNVFNGIYGGNMAIQRCVEFINIVVTKESTREEHQRKLEAWIKGIWLTLTNPNQGANTMI